MATYGYIRKEYPISTVEQVSNLKKYKLDGVFIEEFDFEDDSELTKFLKKLKVNDYLIVTDLLVFAKIKIKFKSLLRALISKKINLISINDKIDTSRNVTFYANNLSVIEMQKKLHSFLVKESIESARSEGKPIGRPKIEPEVAEEIQELYHKKGKSLKEISKICHVSMATVYNYATKE